jgi:hypothetical protein
MGLTDLMLEKIKEEIDNDPEKLGYAGKKDQEIADLLNNNYFTQRIVIDEHPCRIHQILVGIADSPNIVTDAEVTLAKTK